MFLGRERATRSLYPAVAKFGTLGSPVGGRLVARRVSYKVRSHRWHEHSPGQRRATQGGVRRGEIPHTREDDGHGQ